MRPRATSCDTALLRSTDDGLSWRRIGFGLQKNAQVDTYHQPHFSSVVRVGGGLFVGRFIGLYHSTDGGRVWRSAMTIDNNVTVGFAATVCEDGRLQILVSSYVAGLLCTPSPRLAIG